MIGALSRDAAPFSQQAAGGVSCGGAACAADSVSVGFSGCAGRSFCLRGPVFSWKKPRDRGGEEQ